MVQQFCDRYGYPVQPAVEQKLSGYERYKREACPDGCGAGYHQFTYRCSCDFGKPHHHVGQGKGSIILGKSEAVICTALPLEDWAEQEHAEKVRLEEELHERNKKVDTLIEQVVTCEVRWGKADREAKRLAEEVESLKGVWDFNNPLYEVLRRRAEQAEAEVERLEKLVSDRELQGLSWQRGLEQAEAELELEREKFETHTKHVERFLSDMYCTMIDPLVEGNMKVEDTCKALLKAAVDQREREKNQKVSVTWGELNNLVQDLTDPNEWDNMNISEQRNWALAHLATEREVKAKLLEALKVARKLPRPWIHGSISWDTWFDQMDAAIALGEGR